MTEAFRQVDRSFVTEQLNNIPRAVVEGPAVTAARQVLLDLEAQLRCEIAFQIIRQSSADRVAVEFYDSSLG